MQEPESTGDIIDDVHAQEEHAKAIASTAEVPVQSPEFLTFHQAFQLGCPVNLSCLHMHRWALFTAGAVC